MSYGKHVTAGSVPHDIESLEAECDRSATETLRTDCRFAIAHEYWEAKRFERAAPLFLAVAHDGASARAIDAAELALESINALGIDADLPRSVCFDVFADEVPRLLVNICAPTPKPGAERLCAKMHIIDVDLTRCSECVRGTASGRPPEVAYGAAAGIYLGLAIDKCVLGKGRQRINESLGCNELLFHAHAWFSEARDRHHAAQARALLLDPANGLQSTAFAKRLLAAEASGRGRSP